MWGWDISPSRRHFLKHMASLSALALPGMQFVNKLHAAQEVAKKKHKSLILVWLGGGASTIDLWDLKPGSANGGQFKPASTAASGVQISEHLPTVAKQMKHLSIIRSLETTEGDHQRGTQLMNTGRSPNPIIQYPAIGAVAAKILTPKELDLPAFISVGGGAGARVGPGFLGMTYAPFTIQNAGSPPENGKPPQDVGDLGMLRRKAMFEVIEGRNAEDKKPGVPGSFNTGVAGDAAKAHRDVYEKAFSLVVSKRRDVLTFDAKDNARLSEYGNNGFCRGCLLARKLVDAGAVCVEVDLGGWDMHNNIFQSLHTTTGTGRMDQLDKGLGTLIKDLNDRGTLKD